MTEFLEYIDIDGNMDTVQLPPETVDEHSNLEELDEGILDDTVPVDVPGKIELHCNITKLSSEEVDDISDLHDSKILNVFQVKYPQKKPKLDTPVNAIEKPKKEKS